VGKTRQQSLDAVGSAPEALGLRTRGVIMKVKLRSSEGLRGRAKDPDLCGASMREDWQSGYEDRRRMLERLDCLAWLAPRAGTSYTHRNIDQ
jgi:hypothetical protein